MGCTHYSSTKLRSQRKFIFHLLASLKTSRIQSLELTDLSSFGRDGTTKSANLPLSPNLNLLIMGMTISTGFYFLTLILRHQMVEHLLELKITFQLRQT